MKHNTFNIMMVLACFLGCVGGANLLHAAEDSKSTSSDSKSQADNQSAEQAPKAKAASKKPNKPKPLTIDEAILNLGDNSVALRDQAMENLMVRKDLTDDRITNAFTGTDHPEVFHRLVRVAEHRFFSGLGPKLDPKNHQSCLGISLINLSGSGDNIVRKVGGDALERTPAFLISKTYAGFPAHVYLQSGDLITALNRKSFPTNFTTDMFITQLKQMKAGQSAVFTIVRGQRVIRVPIQLDSRERLAAIYPEHGNHQVYLTLWEKQYEKLTAKYKFKAPITLDISAKAELLDPED